MKSVDKLRELGRPYRDRIVFERETFDKCLDKIEREVEDMVPLPVDADGEAIHVGDVMVYTDGDTCPLPVVALVPPAVFITEEGPRYADMCRHHHAPTVEDVLREFGAGWYERMSGPETFDIADYVEEYAAKLTLRGDE